METKKEVIERIDKLYEHLQEAYELAGNLRDTFTGVKVNEHALKEHCNTIRGKIYELRELKWDFKNLVNLANVETY